MKLRNKILSVATGAAALVLGVAPMMSASAAGPEVAAFSGSASATVNLVGGTGNFSFSTGTPLGCTAVDTDEPGVEGACTISASGSFSNIVCGTGTATGNASISDPSDGGTSVSFEIVFAAGVGVLVGTPVPSTQVAGVVVITANSPQTDGTTCTKGFTVNSVDVLPLAA